jgi:hypothetical protein
MNWRLYVMIATRTWIWSADVLRCKGNQISLHSVGILSISIVLWFNFWYAATQNYSVRLLHHTSYNQLCGALYNPTQLISRFACLYPKESKCSKWRDSNFTNNLTLLILFILFHDCWNLQMCWMYGCTLKNVFTTSFCIMFTTCHLQGIEQTPPYVKISNLLSSNLSPLFFLTLPNWLFKSHYSLIGSTVNI